MNGVYILINYTEQTINGPFTRVDPTDCNGKVWNYFDGVTINSNNFPLEVTVILDMKSTYTVTYRVKWPKEGNMGQSLIGLRSKNIFGIQS